MMKYQAKQIFLNNPHCGTFFNQRFGKNEETPSQRHFLNLTNVEFFNASFRIAYSWNYISINYVYRHTVSQVCKEFYCGVRSLRIEKLGNW